jgi:hypothetical protein
MPPVSRVWAGGNGGQAMVVVDPTGKLLYASGLPQVVARGLAIDAWHNVVVASPYGLTRIAEGRLPLDLVVTAPSPCADLPIRFEVRASGANDAGTVELFVDGSPRATGAITNGAFVQTLNLPAGVRRVKATYRGPGPFDGYSSGQALVAVNQAGACQ